MGVIQAQATAGKPLTEPPDDYGGYVGYHDKWAALTDAVKTQATVCVRRGDQPLMGNLRERPGDLFLFDHCAFDPTDAERIWLSWDNVLMIDLSHWDEVEETL